MTIIHTKIDDAAEQYLLEYSQENNLDIDMVFNSAYAFEEPYMQISKIQATTLQFFIKSASINNIIEIGTFVGYSAFSMAKVMQTNNSNVVSIEINKKFYDQAKRNKYEFLEHARTNNIEIGAIENIQFIHSDAKSILPEIHKYISEIDMFFLDGDKANYEFYLDWVIENLKSGAYLMIDNALFKGGVVKGAGAYAISIKKMTEKLKDCGLFDYFFLTVGDCMIVAKKK